MPLPKLLLVSLGGTITMTTSSSGGVVPTLTAKDLVAAVPALAGMAELEAVSPHRLPSASLRLDDLLEVAATPAAAGSGTLVCLNDEIHAARFVQKSHTALPSAFTSPQAGPLGAVIEGMGAGHVPAAVAPLVEDLARQMPVVLASRVAAGPAFTNTYGYPGSEIDLLRRGALPAGTLSGPKARLLLMLLLRCGMSREALEASFRRYAVH
jgi:L-asparaginase